MSLATKYTDFEDWTDACIELGYKLADIKEDKDEYYFEAAGFKIAYWDRKLKFGYISFEG